MTPTSPSKLRNQKKELYHCDRCGELFKAPVMPAERVICNVCGNPPVRVLHSNVDAGDLAASPEELAKQEERHDRKRDVADFVGQKKAKRGKQLQIAFGVWMGMLVIGGGIGIYYKSKQEERAAKQAKKEDSKDYDKIMYNQRTVDALKRTRPVIMNFVQSADNNTRSQYVMDGVDLLVQMQEYYNANPALGVEGQLFVSGVFLDESGDLPRLDTLMEDESGKSMEAVYWLKDGKWRIDWAQMVRYSSTSWNSFLLNKVIGSEGDFRLYVRGSGMRSRQEDEPLNLVFYQPKVFDGDHGVESPVVQLNPHTDLGIAFIEALDKVQKMKPAETVLGKFDPPGWARVNVKLTWVEGKDKPELKIKSLYADHWQTVHGKAVEAED